MNRQEYQRYNRYKWILWIVIASFVLWGADAARETDIRTLAARVGDREISQEEFQNAYRRQSELYRQFAQDNPDMMQGLATQTLDQLVNQKLLLLLAEHHGFGASPREVADEIQSYQIFKDESGRFVGMEQYRAILRDTLRTSAQSYETEVAEMITTRKFQQLVDDMILVAEPDARDEYEETLTVRFDYVKTGLSKFTAQATVTDAELTEHYEKNKELYRAPERRAVKLAYLRPDDFKEQIQVSDAEVVAKYDEDKETRYKQEEERRARHILFKVEGADEAAKAASDAEARAKAEQALARARAGEDIATLARELSQDSSAGEGGDLGFFPRGRMVKPFEEAAFALAPGEISELVKSEFGYHVIKLEEVKAPGYRTLDEVKPSIVDAIRRPKAEEMARTKADELRQKAAAGSLEEAAKELGVTLRDSGLFGREDSVPGIGKADDFTAAVFAAEQGAVSDVIPIVPSFFKANPNIKIAPQGFAIFTLTETRAAEVPPFEEVRAKVEKDVRDAKAKVLAKEEAATIAQALDKAATDAEWAASLASFGYTVQDSGAISSRALLAGIEDSGPAVREAWSKGAGARGAHELASGETIFYFVKEKQPFDEAQFASQRKEIEERIAAQRRSALLSSILAAAREQYEVELNTDIIQQFS